MMSFTVVFPVISPPPCEPSVSLAGEASTVSVTSLTSSTSALPGSGAGMESFSVFKTSSRLTLQAAAVFSILCIPPQHVSTPYLVNISLV